MLSFLLALILITIYNYKQQKLFENILQYKEVKHYLIGYIYMIYLVIMLKEVIGFPRITYWIRVLNVQGNIFDPNISWMPFGNGILYSDYLNIIMFIPLGIILPLMWKKFHKFRYTVKYAFFLSVFIELSQLFTRFRATDVSDLVMNTLGAIIGWFIYFILSKLLLRFIKPIPLFSSSRFLLVEPKLYVLIAAICTFLS